MILVCPSQCSGNFFSVHRFYVQCDRKYCGVLENFTTCQNLRIVQISEYTQPQDVSRRSILCCQKVNNVMCSIVVGLRYAYIIMSVMLMLKQPTDAVVRSFWRQACYVKAGRVIHVLLHCIEWPIPLRCLLFRCISWLDYAHFFYGCQSKVVCNGVTKWEMEKLI